MANDAFEPYAAAVRKLLRGPVYHDESVWSQVRDYEHPIREYLGKVGLGMHLDTVGNFAYLYDASRDDDKPDTLPPLTSRRSLSFMDTLLLVLLRERFDEHEMRDVDNAALLLSADELAEMVGVFLGDQPDARRVESNIGTSITRLKNGGFLKERRDGHYEVRPLIRARVSADELELIKQRLAGYVGHDEDTEEDD
jgi:hypothetical protein